MTLDEKLGIVHSFANLLFTALAIYWLISTIRQNARQEKREREFFAGGGGHVHPVVIIPGDQTPATPGPGKSSSKGFQN